jgi:LysM repeat protein
MRPTRPARRTPASRLRAAALPALALAALAHGCAPVRDQVARQDVESLQSNVQTMESTLQARQAGVYEQIRELREEQNRLDRALEENARQTKNVGQLVERLRERTQEDLDKRDKAQRDAAQAEAEQFARVGSRIDGLQKGLQTVNDNLVAMRDFEQKQEERIVKIQEQFRGQIKVVVEEVGKENQELARSIAALRADLDASRADAAASRQALTDLQGAMQQLAEQAAASQAQVQELAKRVEAARKSAAAAAAAARPNQHTVRAGETLTTIAARYNVGVQELMDKNQITDANTIREGQKLVIPEH